MYTHAEQGSNDRSRSGDFVSHYIPTVYVFDDQLFPVMKRQEDPSKDAKEPRRGPQMPSIYSSITNMLADPLTV